MSATARFIACVISWLVLSVHAQSGASYADVDRAAHDALTDAATCSQNLRECGGVIYTLPDGSYTYTAPVTSDKPFGVDLNSAYDSAPGKVVADYHVHICSPHNAEFANFFSAADAIANKGLGTVGYIFSFCDDNIHRFDPADDDMDDEEIDFVPHADGTRHAPIYLTIGHINGWIRTERA